MPEARSGTRSGPVAAAARASSSAEPDGTTTMVCNVAFCPICLAVTAAQGAAPDAVEHLLNAAREFFLAARAVIDARADHLASGSRSRKLERIEIA